MEYAERVQMLHGATQLEDELEALAYWKGTSWQVTVVLAADLFVERLNVAVRGVFQQDKPVTFRGLRGAKEFHYVRVGAVP